MGSRMVERCWEKGRGEQGGQRKVFGLMNLTIGTFTLIDQDRNLVNRPPGTPCHRHELVRDARGPIRALESCGQNDSA